VSQLILIVPQGTVWLNRFDFRRLELDELLDRQDDFPIFLSSPNTPVMNSPTIPPPSSPSNTLVDRQAESGAIPYADKFLFGAVIVRMCGRNTDHLPARGMFDTGSEVNLISKDWLRRNNMADISLDELKEEVTFLGVEGVKITSRSKAAIHWHMHNSAVQQVEEFFVVDDGTFDMLIGKPFINKNSILEVNKRSPIFKTTWAANMKKRGTLPNQPLWQCSRANLNANSCRPEVGSGRIRPICSRGRGPGAAEGYGRPEP
jgi:hypothetical protein